MGKATDLATLIFVKCIMYSSFSCINWPAKRLVDKIADTYRL